MKLTEEQGVNAEALVTQLVVEMCVVEKELQKLWLKQAQLLAICFGNDYGYAKEELVSDERMYTIMTPQQIAESKARKAMGVAKKSWLRSVAPHWETDR